MRACRRVVRTGSYPLGVVDHGGEDEHAESEEDDEQEELIGTCAKRVPENAQAHEVARQLEDAQDSDEAHHSQEAQHVFRRFGGESAQTDL